MSGLNQSGANDIASFIAGTMLSGSSNIIELTEAGAVRATANDVSVDAVANQLAVTSLSGAGVTVSTSGGGIDGFTIKNSGGVAKFSFQNKTLTIPAASQSTGDNTFSSTDHGLTDNQPLTIGGDIGAMSPLPSDGDTVFAIVIDSDIFQIARSPGGTPVDISNLSGVTSTTFSLPLAVGNSSSNAIMKLNQANTQVSNGNTVTFNSFVFNVPLGAVKSA